MNTWLLKLGWVGVIGLLLGAGSTASAVTATGGSVTNIGIYKIHTFTAIGVTNLVISDGGVVDVLVVAGGGGGGGTIGGGGGGGGVLTNYSYAVTAGTYSVTIGAGGAGAISGNFSVYGTNGGLRGSNSGFGDLIATGGGGGGSYNTAAANGATTGGSGGGLGANRTGTVGMAGTVYQGNAGGITLSNSNYGAGGGGAAAVGANGVAGGPAGAGGDGKAIDISGAVTYYGGGGGGAVRTTGTTPGAGGIGGGGDGSNFVGCAGIANTGGGGGAGGFGGGASYAGGAGGSGIVIVRYLFSPTVDNGSGASNVTAISADLNGTLIATGAAPATVFVYWGASDGGTDPAAWANTNVFAGTPEPGLFSTNVSLIPGTGYFYRYAASNAYGMSWAPSSAYLITSNITVSVTPDAIGQNGATSTFWFARPAIMTNGPVTVNFTTSGTASNGFDYTLSRASNVVLASGVCSASVQVVSGAGIQVNSDRTLILTVSPGAYSVTPETSATLTITNTPLNFTWKGGANGDWFGTANWSLLGVPGAGDSVAVTNGSILLTNSTANLASFTISNATLTVTNWATALTATEVQIRNLGILTHGVCGSTTGNPTNRVYVVCSNLTVNSGGLITAKGLGYQGGPGSGTSRSSGSYGGRGGDSGLEGVEGEPYGSALTPTGPGSGGNGQRGGGSVRLEASGRVVVDGTIDADAFDYTGGWSGVGSGGAIWISCLTFGGRGTLRAIGDTAGNSDATGGGGGRIAVHFDSVAQVGQSRPAVRITTVGGARTVVRADYFDGEMGSIYLTDGQVIPTNMTSWYGQLYGPTNWYFPEMTMSTSTIRMGGPYNLGTPFTIDVAGNFTMRSNSLLTLYGGLTNGAGWTNGYGARLTVSNDWLIGSNCWVYPISYLTTNGASLFFEASNLTVQATAGINADSSGYALGYGAGRSYFVDRVGGGYGGTGQGYSEVYGGKTYGSSNAPVEPGSPGNDAKGGGLIRILVTRTIQNDGTLTANGANLSATDVSTGSGGGIFLQCRRWAGVASAIMRAKGGDAAGSNCRSGGGGRIAVWRAEDAFFGTYNVTYGANGVGGTPLAQPGTVVLSNLIVEGACNLIVAASPAQHDSPSPAYGGTLVNVDSVVNATVTSPANQSGGTRYVCVGWALTNTLGVVSNNSSTDVSFSMTTNLWLTWYWTNSYYLSSAAGANGTIVSDKTGWYTNGTQVTLQATPGMDAVFMQWSGDVPAGQQTANPLTVTMDRARTIIANFASTTPGTRCWTGTGDWFANATNWSPSGVPGPLEDVVVGSGSLTLRDSAQVRSVTVTNGTLTVQVGVSPVTLTVSENILVSNVAASLTLSNATLLCGQNMTLASSSSFTVYAAATNASTGATGAYVRVGSNLQVGNNCWIYPWSHASNGGSPLFSVGQLTLVGPSGGFNADEKGYVSPYGPGWPGASTKGGAYGGNGGGNSANTRTYGDSNAPVQCGSPGYRGEGPSWNGRGGGLVRVHVDGAATVNGVISANGQGVTNSTITSVGYYGCGSGGGIYITCASMSGAATGVIRANGGVYVGTQLTPTDAAGGGGGRIAIWAPRYQYTGTYSVSNGVSYAGCNVAGSVGTVVIKMSRGVVFTLR